MGGGGGGGGRGEGTLCKPEGTKISFLYMFRGTDKKEGKKAFAL